MISFTRAKFIQKTIRYHLNLCYYSDMMMLSGAVAETFVGPVMVASGMSDVLGASGGTRVTAISAIQLWRDGGEAGHQRQWRSAGRGG